MKVELFNIGLHLLKSKSEVDARFDVASLNKAMDKIDDDRFYAIYINDYVRMKYDTINSIDRKENDNLLNILNKDIEGIITKVLLNHNIIRNVNEIE